MKLFTNKKLIISLLITGAVIGFGIYIYRKNNKPKDTTNTGGTANNGMATESDALKMAEILSKKDEPVPVIFMQNFVDLYTKNISKKTHNTLVVIANKKESDWTTQEKLDMSILINKVFLPLSAQIGQAK